MAVQNKNNELSIHDSHNTLKQLVEKADLAYIRLNSNIQVVEWNRASERMFGYKEDEAFGNYLNRLIPEKKENKQSEFLSSLKKCSTTSRYSGIHLDRYNKEVCCDWYFKKIVTIEGSFTGFFLIAVTWDSPKKTDVTSKSKNLQFQSFFEMAPFGIFQASINGDLTAANPELAWMLGYDSPESLIEKKLNLLKHVFENEKLSKKFFFTLFEAEQVKRLRAQLRRKNGSPYWVAVFAKPSQDDSGRINGIYGLFTDIRQTVRAENKLKTLNQKLKRLSNVDGLTRIANRRRFNEYLSNEWNRLQREKSNLSLILCDIDYFKFYNDTYGHQAGDQCLRTIAETINNQPQRPADLAARYGGEEFTVILPNTDLEGAKCIAEKIRTAVHSLQIDHSASKIDDYVTLSLGVSSLKPDQHLSYETLISMADMALYQAKEMGRNRSITAHSIPE